MLQTMPWSLSSRWNAPPAYWLPRSELKDAATGLSARQCHAKGIKNNGFLETLAQRPTNDRRERRSRMTIRPSFLGVDVRDVAGPHAVGCADLLDVETTVEEVGRNGMFVLGIRGHAETPT
jgi:hypothetical protein